MHRNTKIIKKMNIKYLLIIALTASFLISCGKEQSKSEPGLTQVEKSASFDYNVEQFADVKILRYQIPGWENLTLKEQKLVYYLTQAGLSGRDIIWDQNYRHNLKIRKALEHVYTNYGGDKESDDWKAFETYLKRVWFSNGIHHHYSADKFKPDFSADYLTYLLKETDVVLEGEPFDVIFNDSDSKKVNLAKGVDNVGLSAVNFYSPNVSNSDVESFYAKVKSPNPDKPLSHGLNSKLVKENGKLMEKVYKSGGLYGSCD